MSAHASVRGKSVQVVFWWSRARQAFTKRNENHLAPAFKMASLENTLKRIIIVFLLALLTARHDALRLACSARKWSPHLTRALQSPQSGWNI